LKIHFHKENLKVFHTKARGACFKPKELFLV